MFNLSDPMTAGDELGPGDNRLARSSAAGRGSARRDAARLTLVSDASCSTARDRAVEHVPFHPLTIATGLL